MANEPTPARNSTSADRLCAISLMSSLLIVLLVIVLSLLGLRYLRQHAEKITDQDRTIEQLQSDLDELREELATRPPRRPRQDRQPTPVTPQPDTGNSPVTPTTVPEPAPTAAAAPEKVPAVADSVIDGLLSRAMRTGETPPYELADQTAAQEALRVGLRDAATATWSGETWAGLAVLAHLQGRDAPAEMFALRAEGARTSPYAFYELSALARLAENRIDEAITFGQRMVNARPDDPRGRLLLAGAQRRNGDLAAVDETLAEITNTQRLTLPEKLKFGRLLLITERWARLDALLATINQVPAGESAEVNFLRAVLAIQRGRLPEALAILDNLLAESPGEYRLLMWRGVALLDAGQLEAARETLAETEQQADRPEGWYWRGMVELQAGNAAAAISMFQHALAASQRFAPAWEALGTIALNRGDLQTAMQNVTNALAANSRRAPAHFLVAIIHAKASRTEETAGALRTAFALDPSLLEVAEQTPVITAILSQDALAQLAGKVGE